MVCQIDAADNGEEPVGEIQIAMGPDKLFSLFFPLQIVSAISFRNFLKV